MSHLEQRIFCAKVKEKLPTHFKNKKVLDIGSLDINGNNRFLFENCNYIGIDVGEGNNVDYISIGHLYDGPDNYFDTIISTEVFEHDMFYEETIKNIMRMLKPGGLFLFTCASTGRPEHGTRRCGEDCAPLLIQVSEDWADYYKNLVEHDIRKISGFNEMFPDCHFEMGNMVDSVAADLYFYGVKGGEKYLTDNVISEVEKGVYKDDIFVIDSWPDNQSKENDLVELIKILKSFNIPILLTGHYPIKPEIQKMVDYYLFDKNNPILTFDEFVSNDVASGRWTEMSDHKIDNKYSFHHDFAIWETMRNAFNFCNFLGKKNIHFFEYDNLPNKVQYRQAFLERMNSFDAVLYEYSENSATNSNFTEYCATYIFSIKTDIAIKVINEIKTKEEYFRNRPGGWQLERVFLNNLRKFTNNIYITNYVSNNNELNTQAVWNRDGMFRNGAVFQTYIAVDKKNKLYLHLISGFSEVPADKDYLIEIRYLKNKQFVTLNKDGYLTIQLGNYVKGANVIVLYQGVEVYREFLGEDASKCRDFNEYISKKEEKTIGHKPKKVNLNFIDGAYLEILDDVEYNYDVRFINKQNNKIEFQTNLKSNHWCKTSIKYYIDWIIVIDGIDNDFNYEHHFNLEGNNVMISFETKSLGDNLSMIPYVDEFRKQKKCNVVCSTFHNNIFEKQYPEITFIEPGTSVNNLYALYRLGVFYKENRNGIDYNSHPTNPLEEPLTKISSDILGLSYKELKPKLPKLGKKKQKRVCLGIHSTAQCKYWNNPNGWQEVTDYLISKGYEVRILSKEEDGYMGNKNPKGTTQQPLGTVLDIIKTLQESQLFIGVSSGLSWVSWGSNTPTILISGFTDIYTEPFDGIERIINKDVCHGCWNKYDFDPGDWNWCPVHNNTDRQFECTKEITSQQVIDKINKVLGINNIVSPS